MELHEDSITKQTSRQKNLFNGKLFLNSYFLCQRRVSELSPQRSSISSKPAGTFILAGWRSLKSQSLPAQTNKLCRYGNGVEFLSLSQTLNGTNGINTFRTTETNVAIGTNEPMAGAREDIAQKDLCFCGAEADIKYRLIERLKQTVCSMPSPNYN